MKTVEGLADNEIMVNGKVYVLKEEQAVATKNRAVVVLDRGWIFGGDVVDLPDGGCKISRVCWPMHWSEIGFDGMIDNPFDKRVTLKQMTGELVVKPNVELFRRPVPDNWALKK